MPEFKCPFTGQEYDDYRRKTYKYYDRRKIQELQELIHNENYGTRYNSVWWPLMKIERMLKEAEISYNIKNDIKYDNDS